MSKKSEINKARWDAYREPAFWSRVDRRGEDECWPWRGKLTHSRKNPRQYGQLGWKGRITRAHRVAFEIAVQLIPEGAFVLHRCDNTLCCNPKHLYLGDHAQNMRDMVERRRRKGVGLGENNARAKLTQQQAGEIRSLYASGLAQQAIADAYGISQFAVSQIVRGKRYKE